MRQGAFGLWALALVGGLALAGCEVETQTSIEHGIATMDHARKTQWELQANNAVRMLIAQGTKPASLEEVEAKVELRSLPEGYVWSYNASTGQLSIVPE